MFVIDWSGWVNTWMFHLMQIRTIFKDLMLPSNYKFDQMVLVPVTHCLLIRTNKWNQWLWKLTTETVWCHYFIQSLISSVSLFSSFYQFFFSKRIHPLCFTLLFYCNLFFSGTLRSPSLCTWHLHKLTTHLKMTAADLTHSQSTEWFRKITVKEQP